MNLLRRSLCVLVALCASASAILANDLAVSWRDGGSDGNARALSCVQINNNQEAAALLFLGLMAAVAEVDLHTVRIEMTNQSGSLAGLKADQFKVEVDGQRVPCLSFVTATGGSRSSDELYLRPNGSMTVYAVYMAPNAMAEKVRSGYALLHYPRL